VSYNYWRHYQRVPEGMHEGHAVSASGHWSERIRELLLITASAAGAAMELRLDPTPFAWVGW
jgi:hypothetical protein